MKHLFPYANYHRCDMCGVRRDSVNSDEVLEDEETFHLDPENCVKYDIKLLCDNSEKEHGHEDRCSKRN